MPAEVAAKSVQNATWFEYRPSRKRPVGSSYTRGFRKRGWGLRQPARSPTMADCARGVPRRHGSLRQREQRRDPLPIDDEESGSGHGRVEALRESRLHRRASRQLTSPAGGRVLRKALTSHQLAAFTCPHGSSRKIGHQKGSNFNGVEMWVRRLPMPPNVTLNEQRRRRLNRVLSRVRRRWRRILFLALDRLYVLIGGDRASRTRNERSRL